MTIVGLMGNQGTGKTTILKLFDNYVEEQKIEKVEGGIKCSIEKTDFKGETEIKVDDDEGYTKTVTPNKVVFIETESGESHTLFAPGGDRDRAVVRMGIITISLIAKEVVAVFDVSQTLKEQFKLYDLIRYLPKSVYLCLNKYDLIASSQNEDPMTNEKIQKIKGEVDDYFCKRRIEIKSTFYTCAIDKEGFKKFNDNAAKMLLDICLGRV